MAWHGIESSLGALAGRFRKSQKACLPCTGAFQRYREGPTGSSNLSWSLSKVLLKIRGMSGRAETWTSKERSSARQRYKSHLSQEAPFAGIESAACWTSCSSSPGRHPDCALVDFSTFVCVRWKERKRIRSERSPRKESGVIDLAENYSPACFGRQIMAVDVEEGSSRTNWRFCCCSFSSPACLSCMHILKQ